MNEETTKKLLDELIPSLEALETQSTAVLRLLQEGNLVSQEQLASYLEQAGNASNVRWRATHLRIEHILAEARVSGEKRTEPGVAKPPKQDAENENKTLIAHSSMAEHNEVKDDRAAQPGDDGQAKPPREDATKQERKGARAPTGDSEKERGTAKEQGEQAGSQAESGRKSRQQNQPEAA
jgi:hypothetical protein